MKPEALVFVYAFITSLEWGTATYTSTKRVTANITASAARQVTKKQS